MTDIPTITPEQCIAARALLRWDQETLAKRSGLSRRGIQNLEAGALASARPTTVNDLVQAFEAAGIRFVHEPGPGVILAPSASTASAPPDEP